MVTFVDQEKAFDRVDREMLWKTLSYYGVNNHLIGACKSLYNDCRSVVRTNKGMSTQFLVTPEVRQGCILSPLLFTTYIDMNKRTNVYNATFKHMLFAETRP